MRMEGFSSRAVRVSVYAYSGTAGYIRGGLSTIQTAAELPEPEMWKSDYAETTAFESEKLARSRNELRGPTHQLTVRMRILLYAFELRAAQPTSTPGPLALCMLKAQEVTSKDMYPLQQADSPRAIY